MKSGQFKVYSNRWPNGRQYWTVEDKAGNQYLCGASGCRSVFYDREQAKAARDNLNGVTREKNDSESLLEEAIGARDEKEAGQ